MNSPQVYCAITAITEDISRKGVAKGQLNLRDQYFYRSIDDVQNCLAPLLSRHRLCILPRVLQRTTADKLGEQGAQLVSVGLHMAFDLVSAEDGSSHTIAAFGEALDAGDKATAKAMTAAYKSAVVQLFCIPTVGDDADAESIRLRPSSHEPQPVQGWEQWAKDIIDMIGICESREALERIQTRQRSLLKAISRERQDLYASIGEAFTARIASLAAPSEQAESAQEQRAVPAPAKRKNGEKREQGAAISSKATRKPAKAKETAHA